MRLSLCLAALATALLRCGPALAGLLPAPGGAEPSPLPEPLRSLAAWAFALQRQFNADMHRNLDVVRETGSWEPAAAIVFAAFLYGVFHAIGPGHGKVVIASWVATRRVRLVHGLSACLIAALAQAGTAIFLVGGAFGLLHLAPSRLLDHAAWIEAGSYALIAGLGGLAFWRTLTNRGCGHDHGAEAAACTCGHDHHHEHHHHEHAPPAESRSTLFAVAAAVGLRPCTGALLVLLFTFANGLIALGILATLAMGMGVAITVGLIGTGALGLNRLIDGRFGDSARGQSLRKGLALAGAGAVTLLGLSLLIGALAFGPTLSG